MAAETGSAREEAERLVAALLAMAGQTRDQDPGGTNARLRDGLGSLGDTVSGLVARITEPAGGSRPAGDPPGGRSAGDGSRHVRYGWATGSLECCVCPVCRMIAGARDPNPRGVERLATGAGDFAMGVASLMRGLSAVAGEVRPAARPAAAPPTPPPAPDPDTAWSAATRTSRPGQTDAGTGTDPAPPDPDESPWAAATRAEARVAAAARAAQKARDEQAREEQAREEQAREEREARERQAREATEAPADPTPPEKPAPAPARAPRPGEDVWAAATSTDEVGMAGRTGVDHDGAGDEALGRD